jgi:hypothetical protein
MKKFILYLVSIYFISSGILHAQLVGGNIYQINGVQNPPAFFENVFNAVSYLIANGVTGSGEVILELNSGISPIEPGPITINAIPGAGATLGVTFRPAAGYTANTLVVGSGAPQQYAISLSGCSYITLDGRSGGVGSSRNWTIKVLGSGTTGNGLMAIQVNGTSGSMAENTIRNTILIGEASNNTFGVFYLTAGTSNTVKNLIVENNLITSTATSSLTTRAYGIAIATINNAGNTGIVFRNNEITNVYGRGISQLGACPGMQIHDNKVYHTIPITQPTTMEFSGIYFASGLTNAHSNRIFNNYIYGIRLTNGATAVNGFFSINSPTSGERLAVYNNMISIGQDLTGTAARLPVYGIRESSLSTARYDIFFNTVYVGGTLDSGASVSSAFRKQTSNNIALVNNIFYNARSNNGGTGTHYGIMINNLNATTRNYNDYYVSGSGGVFGTITGTAAGNQLTLEDWKAASGRDTNSVSENVFFNNTLTGNLHLISPSIGDTVLKGIPFGGVTTDIDGDLRNAIAPYMGADEGDIPLSINNDFSIPAEFILYQNYPNPFNPTTNIKFLIPFDANITLEVYNISGKIISSLIENKNYTSGLHSISFNGNEFSSGIYFYRLLYENIHTKVINSHSKKMILLK